MSTSTLAPVDLTDTQFNRISELVRELCGINLHQGKKELVKARLAKRLRHLGCSDFGEYIDHVCADAAGDELTQMLDVLSTNLTSFFRENDHFVDLAERALPAIIRGGGKRLRIWSAGCSSGEEPYSIGMTLRETISDLNAWDARILATDISTRVLARASAGQYGPNHMRNVPPQIRGRYFVPEGRSRGLWRVCDSVRSLVCFARLNLMERWPMQGPFDIIFCRNVMIYFDKPTQQRLVDRFHAILRPGGSLFIGHSESLTGIRHSFGYVRPTVYQKR
jgi:chemotaxis protein methyltransferase CheR